MRLLVSGATTSMEKFAADPTVSPHVGHLWTPATGNDLLRQARTGLPWAMDNAAFGSQWKTEAFQKAVLLKAHRCPTRPLFVPVPDVVGDSKATLALFHVWEAVMNAAGLPLALVLQDGAEDQLLPWNRLAAVFLGGSRKHPDGRPYLPGHRGPCVEWKESAAAADLIREARRRGLHVHVGRVNGMARMRHFFELGADTADGSSFSRFPNTWVPVYVATLRAWKGAAAVNA